MNISSRLMNKALSCVGFIAMTLVTAVVAAQSGSDFENAAGKSGCGLIPYSNLRSNCDSKGRDVNNYCKSKTWNCDDLNPEGLVKNIEKCEEED